MLNGTDKTCKSITTVCVESVYCLIKALKGEYESRLFHKLSEVLLLSKVTTSDYTIFYTAIYFEQY